MGIYPANPNLPARNNFREMLAIIFGTIQFSTKLYTQALQQLYHSRRYFSFNTVPLPQVGYPSFIKLQIMALTFFPKNFKELNLQNNMSNLFPVRD